MQLRPQPNFSITIGAGVGGAIETTDGTHRFVSMSMCLVRPTPVFFGTGDYTLDNGESGIQYSATLEGNATDGITRQEAKSTTNLKMVVPCDPATGKCRISFQGDAGLISTYSGDPVCFFIYIAGDPIPFAFKLVPCSFITDPVTNEQIIINSGKLVFTGQSTEPPPDDGPSVIGAIISGSNYDEVEFYHSDPSIFYIQLAEDQFFLDTSSGCTSVSPQPLPPSGYVCSQSNLNATYELNANIRFGSDDWLGFRVVGGIECNGKVDPNNTGMIYYLGKNTLGVDEVGQPLFTVTYENGTFSYSPMLNITQEWRITDSSKVEIELVDTCINDEEPEPEPEPFPEDEPIDVLEPDECLSCHVSIDDCCEDDNFTTDIEQFSSIVVPDTYINQETGDEERIPWNGLMHVSQILNTGFKTFFAMVYHLSCIWWNNIKTVTNKFVEFFNKFDNWFRYKFDSGEGGIVDYNIPKAIVDEGIEIQEGVQCICDKFDSFNNKIDTLNTKIDTLNTNLLTIANNISTSSSSGVDLSPIVLALSSINSQLSPSGLNYTSLGTVITSISRALGVRSMGHGYDPTLGYSNSILEKLDNLQSKLSYSVNDVDNSISKIIYDKQFEISNPESLAPVNEIIIESQNYGYVGNGRYSFDDSL